MREEVLHGTLVGRSRPSRPVAPVTTTTVSCGRLPTKLIAGTGDRGVGLSRKEGLSGHGVVGVAGTH